MSFQVPLNAAKRRAGRDGKNTESHGNLFYDYQIQNVNSMLTVNSRFSNLLLANNTV
jgi:hypothetical protein